MFIAILIPIGVYGSRDRPMLVIVGRRIDLFLGS